ncbi:uncharacterized protein N7503_011368 [Penicillium pulvis]|uniref:uncharacterized protein n=1 Tax=Penicillium pulvis TaxID=1562058 RepID=UPI0025466A0D|nr:uncharacterized protein N7503_011368 [Penicillium pulvis]KAJ5786156.1 hypothetical protein N7503_011368 [Penicillium pulvis]
MDGSLGEQSVSGAAHYTPSNPSEPKCSELFRITPPESWAIDTGNFCLPISIKPKLSFQIQQRSSWNQGSIFPLFNIWRPGLFGSSLSQLGSDPVKLNRKNDLIVTAHENDTIDFKECDNDIIAFSTEGLIAGIDVDPPPSSLAKCAVATEDECSCPTASAGSGLKSTASTINSSATMMLGIRIRSRGLPKDLPFAIDEFTRVCRINKSGVDWEADPNESPVAVMNRDGFVFLDGMGSKMAESQSEDNRNLILLSGLAIAQYEGWLTE